ncbi:MAG: Bug family tripartite tricarboxylate transporter substrate binding protein [Thermodesulfobacteriota bacterium]
MKKAVKITGLGLILMMVLVPGLGVAQTSAEQFYRGKTINWVVSAEPGGGTDLVTRLLVPHLARETGAKVFVKNMTGGSMEGNNWVYNEAKRDGLTLLTEGTMPLLLNDLLKLPGTRYQTSKFLYLSSVDSTMSVLAISPKCPYKTLDALRKAKGLKVGASSAGGHIAILGTLCLDILGLDGKVITGYSGSKSVLLAVAQGEMDIVSTSDVVISRAEKQGDVTALFLVGAQKSPLYPKLPTLPELGVNIPKEYNIVLTNSKSIVFPPGVPEDRVTYLRKIFKKLGDVKEVQTDMTRYAGVWYPFTPGEEAQEDVVQFMSNKALGDRLSAMLKKYTATK